MGCRQNLLKKYKRGSRTLISWFVSYIAVICVPILLSFFMFSYVGKILSGHIRQMQEDSVNQLKSVCDGKMEKIHVIGRQIAENPDITGFMEYEATQSGESKLAIQSVFKYLQAQMANENCISDIFIFSRKSRYLISPRQASNEMGSHGFDYERHFNRSEKELWEMLDHLNQPVLILEDSLGQSHLYYYSVIMSENIRNPDGWILIQLDLEAGNFQNGRVLEGIMTGNGIFYDIGRKKCYDGEIAEELKQMAPYTRIQKEGEDIFIAKVKSEAENWEYYCGIDTLSLFRNINHTRNAYICFILASSVISVLLAHYLAKKQYNPVLKLIEAIGQQHPAEPAGNEFEYLQKTFQTIARDRYALENQIDKEKDIIVNNILSRIIKGYYVSTAEIENALEQYCIHFPHHIFRMVLFSVDDYSNLFFDNDAKNKVETYDLVHFLIKNIATECMRETFEVVEPVECDNFVVLLVNYSSREEQAVEELIAEKSNKTREFLKDRMGLAVSWFCSFECIRLTELRSCYSECLMSMGDGGNIDREIDSNIRNRKEWRLVNFLKNGNLNSAEMVLRDIIQEVRETDGDAISARLYLFHILFLIRDASSGRAELAAGCDENKIMGIMNCYDNDRIADSMIRLFAMLKNNASAGEHVRPRAERIKEYIDTNYTSPDLSLSSIAEKFQISEGYVTRLMKKEYDMKVSQYVNEKRIERVKYLMKDDSLNINDIAEQAGFYSYRTMIRSFKQSEGVTPTEYRKKKDEKKE